MPGEHTVEGQKTQQTIRYFSAANARTRTQCVPPEGLTAGIREIENGAFRLTRGHHNDREIQRRSGRSRRRDALRSRNRPFDGCVRRYHGEKPYHGNRYKRDGGA
jgi:hypothetical protein